MAHLALKMGEVGGTDLCLYLCFSALIPGVFFSLVLLENIDLYGL